MHSNFCKIVRIRVACYCLRWNTSIKAVAVRDYRSLKSPSGSPRTPGGSLRVSSSFVEGTSTRRGKAKTAASNGPGGCGGGGGCVGGGGLFCLLLSPISSLILDNLTTKVREIDRRRRRAVDFSAEMSTFDQAKLQPLLFGDKTRSLTFSLLERGYILYFLLKNIILCIFIAMEA